MKVIDLIKALRKMPKNAEVVRHAGFPHRFAVIEAAEERLVSKDRSGRLHEHDPKGTGFVDAVVVKLVS